MPCLYSSPGGENMRVSTKETGTKLRQKLMDILGYWKKTGFPSREKLVSTADELMEWKKKNHTKGIWGKSPLMVTATLDDTFGHGLQLIHLYAKVAGIKITPIGLLQTPEQIIETCREVNPDFLGLTVLQFDSEEALTAICSNLPSKTKVVVGGPIFKADPDLAQRAGVAYVAKNVSFFLEYLLTSSELDTK